MPILFSAIIGYVRLVIGQGRKLSWVKSSFFYSVFNEKREPPNIRERCYFLAKKINFWRVCNPLPGVPCMVGENRLKVRIFLLAFGCSGLIVGPRTSHFVFRPQ